MINFLVITLVVFVAYKQLWKYVLVEVKTVRKEASGLLSYTREIQFYS
jgi:hypothetical protein